MREAENIRSVVDAGSHWMGFIFYPKSPRFVEKPDSIRNLTEVKKVGVFVNEELDKVQDIIEDYGLDMVQLHGEETTVYCDSISGVVEVMKAFRIKDASDFDVVTPYSNSVDYYLFDTRSVKGHGGTGEKFDWKLLNNYKGTKPFLLSGGITLEDVEAIKEIDHPQLMGVDINSGFEIAPALKNVPQVKEFIKQISD